MAVLLVRELHQVESSCNAVYLGITIRDYHESMSSVVRLRQRLQAVTLGDYANMMSMECPMGILLE